MIHSISFNSGNVLGAKPYSIGYPKCRNFGMSDSSKYPGLCKQYDNENTPTRGNEYADLEFNSINARRENSASHYTYKTYNSEYDNKRMIGSRSSTSNNVPTTYYTQNRQQQNYGGNNANNNNNGNNEVHSFVKRLSPLEQNTANRQQQQHQQQQRPSYSRQIVTAVAPASHETTPFLQEFHRQHQQHYEKRPVDKTNPFQTYRWDQLFKNYV